MKRFFQSLTVVKEKRLNGIQQLHLPGHHSVASKVLILTLSLNTHFFCHNNKWVNSYNTMLTLASRPQPDNVLKPSIYINLKN